MSDESAALKMALQESDHIQGEISRAIGGMYTAFGVVIPAIFGIILFSAGREGGYLPIEFMSLALAGVFSLTILYSASLWMEAIQAFRYKYLVLLPRAYRLLNQSDEENYLQYQARTRSDVTWLPSLLFQGLAFVLVSIVSIVGVLEGAEASGRNPNVLIGVVAISLLIAFGGALCTLVLGRRVTLELRRSHKRPNPSESG